MGKQAQWIDLSSGICQLEKLCGGCLLSDSVSRHRSSVLEMGPFFSKQLDNQQKELLGPTWNEMAGEDQ